MKKPVIGIIVMLLVGSALVLWGEETEEKSSPPTQQDVLRAINRYTSDSVCWGANISTGFSEKTIYACINFINSTAFWKTNDGIREHVIVWGPENNDAHLKDLAFNSVGIEWNVLNFIRYVVQNGELVNVTPTGELYIMEFRFNTTEVSNAGTIEEPYIVRVNTELKLALEVDSDGKPIRGSFEQKIYRMEGNTESRNWMRGNFTFLGSWRKQSGG